ncbi:MAG: methyltransferase [Anaerolineales bacterium]
MKILRNCRAAMKPGQRLLMPDFLVIRDDFNTLVPFMDMAGMLIYSGRERSAEVLAGMLKEAGFEFGRSFPLPGRQVVYEAIAV